MYVIIGRKFLCLKSSCWSPDNGDYMKHRTTKCVSLTNICEISTYIHPLKSYIDVDIGYTWWMQMNKWNDDDFHSFDMGKDTIMLVRYCSTKHANIWINKYRYILVFTHVDVTHEISNPRPLHKVNIDARYLFNFYW